MNKVSSRNLQNQSFLKIIVSFFLLLLITSSVVKGQSLSNYPCYAIASNNSETDSLFKYSPDTNIWTNVGALENVNVKALAINPFCEVLYATNGPLFGTIDTVNADFKSIALIGPAYKGDYGAIVIQNIVGLAYDIDSKRLFGINRITNQVGTGQPDSPDVLVELNCFTGKIVQNAFEDSNGNPADYAKLEEVNDGTAQDYLFDAKDLAFDPITGELLVAQFQDSPTYLTSVDRLTGRIDFVLMEVSESVVSGLAFTEYGNLLGTTLYNPDFGSYGKLIGINYSSGYTNDLGFIDLSNYEFHCLDCFVSKPGCYDTLYLNSTNNYPKKKYKARDDIEIDMLVDTDTLDVFSESEILMTNNFEVLPTSNFCASIKTGICQ